MGNAEVFAQKILNPRANFKEWGSMAFPSSIPALPLHYLKDRCGTKSLPAFNRKPKNCLTAPLTKSRGSDER